MGRVVRLMFGACSIALFVATVGGDAGHARPARGKPVSLSIVPGAQGIARGDHLRLALLIRYDDGSVRNLASSATWASSAPEIVSVASGGRARARTNGRASITATIPAGKATTMVQVGERSLGPLRVSRRNPRYFEDARGRVVYLAGDHTWGNLQDNGTTDPPPRFAYGKFLEYLQERNLRVFRLWSWEQASKTGEIRGDYFFSPTVYLRTGPGKATDGKLRFDLHRFNPRYFQRLRRRVIAARERGIYVIVMLFDGWSIERKGDGDNPWTGHPYNRANNVNGLDGDIDGNGFGEETHTLAQPAVTRLQEAYVARIIRAVGDQPNVLYEVSNESSPGSMAWQDLIMRFVRAQEPPRFRHPIGTTVEFPGGSNSDLFASVADWVAPNGDVDDPQPSSGRKVVFADTDHLCGVCGSTEFPWRAFTRGLNPMFMDPYDGKAIGLGALGRDPRDPRWAVIKRRLGVTESVSEQLNMGKLVPRGELSSTGYCLADRGGTLYVVYFPDGGSATVDVSWSRTRLRLTWVDPDTAAGSPGGILQGGGQREVRAPGTGDAVLIIRTAR